MRNEYHYYKLLLSIPIFLLFHFCETEEDSVFPLVENDKEIPFSEGIKGTWRGQAYYLEYFDEDEELLFKDHLNVFIDKIILDVEKMTIDYKNSGPDYIIEYSTRTENDMNFIVFPFIFPEVWVSELQIKPQFINKA